MVSKVQKNLPCGSGETTETTPEVMRDRLILLFSGGFFASLTLFFVDRFLFSRHGDISLNPLSEYYVPLYLSIPISFLLASILLYFHRCSLRKLQILNYLVLTFNIIVVSVSFAVFNPSLPPTFPLALMLFVQAALIPGRVWVQLSLGITATLALPITEAWAYFRLPDMQQFWMAKGGSAVFWQSLLSHTVDVGILAGIAVLITYTLYNYRRDLSKARRMGNYLIEGEIGRGGMGTVYKASHTFLARPTAIKIMVPQEGDGETAVRRFEKEVKLSAALTHPNTITLYDYGHCENFSFYYAMELLEGMDLEKLVKKFGPLSADRTIYILKQVCGSLGEAHRMGIIHRDIKPSNIFLTKRGGIYDYVKVLDFGLAKKIRHGETADPTITKAGSLLGTPRYIAPESIHSKGEVDGRTDIYMLGSVAYWLLTGQPPFEGTSSVDLIVDHVKTTPKRPGKVSEIPIPEELENIVMKCLEKKKEDRYQSPEDLAFALEGVPLEKPWTEVEARNWWSLHLAEEEMEPHLTPQKDVPGGEYPPVKAVVG